MRKNIILLTLLLSVMLFSQTAVVGPVPGVVAKFDATAQAADLAVTTMYTPALSGTYRINCYAVVTQAATTSSTLGNCLFRYTDADSSTVETPNITQITSGNTVGSAPSGLGNGGTAVFQAKAGTNIQYGTYGYASVGVTPMQFAIHYKLEYLGQ